MRVMIAAGGTGGHLFPAEALSRALGERGHEVALITDRRTAERASKLFASVHVVGGGGLAGKSFSTRLRSAAALARGTIEARGALSRVRPDALVGFGGYPSVPPVIAGRTLWPRPAIVLHDQNATLGGANRVLGHFADAIAKSFERVAGVPKGTRSVVVGNPVRAVIANVGPYRPPTDRIELLVLGGSLGARIFSDVVPATLACWPRERRARVRVTQQARLEDVERVQTAYAAAGIEADISPFFPDVAGLLERAHLVIARSGGSTIAELAAAGRPALLVPLPIAAGDEQAANASQLVEAGGAWMVRQPGFTTAWLAEQLDQLLADPDLIARAAEAARRLGRPNAAEDLASLVEQLAAGRYDVRRPIRDIAPRDGKGIG
jgi:UDP-N-acetylglucosamine--N-acetylmuramyl-(pentapeptide) pyrophosphoryl-undecaprenol N-acetylglucosamine transferase